MKRGAKPKFKELASSPVKQKPGGIVGEAVDHWQKYKAKKKAFKEFDKWHKTLEKSDRYYRENPQYKKPVKDLISKKPSGNIAQAFKTTAGKLLGGLGYDFIPYDNTTPIISGISQYSLYSKLLRHMNGFLAINLGLPNYEDVYANCCIDIIFLL